MLDVSATYAPALPTDLLGIIAEVRSRWRMKLALRGVVRVLAIAVVAVLPRRCATLMRVGALQPARRSSLARVALAVASWRVRLLVPGAAAAAPRHRRAGGAVSRRARAVAAGDAAQRGRSEPHGQPRSRRRSCGASSSRRSRRARAERGAPRRACAAARATALALGARRCGRRCSLVLLGPAFLRHALSAMLLGAAQRRGRGAAIASRSRPATPRCRRAPTRRSPRRSLGFDAEDASLMVRRTPTGEFEPLPLVRNDNGELRRHAVRRQRADSSTSSRPTACSRRSTR